uniref:Uncharacterized protein n=1 Tax=Anguilla anguilla TaxID=7936 RepID=A0A0E9V2P1_ANGAN
MDVVNNRIHSGPEILPMATGQWRCNGVMAV